MACFFRSPLCKCCVWCTTDVTHSLLAPLCVCFREFRFAFPQFRPSMQEPCPATTVAHPPGATQGCCSQVSASNSTLFRALPPRQDRLEAIDSQNCIRMPLVAARRLISGLEGSPVTLTFTRRGMPGTAFPPATLHLSHSQAQRQRRSTGAHIFGAGKGGGGVDGMG